MVSVKDAIGNASKFYFDHHGLLVKAEDPLGSSVHLSFDNNYNLTQLTDAVGKSYKYSYDTTSNLTSSIDAMGNVTRFAFVNPFNRLSQVIDAKSNITKYKYDSYGNLRSITYADTNQESWDYDDKGNATTWTNRRGRTTNYEYDPNGRITAKVYADNSRIDYAYDELRGNLLSAEEKDSNGLTIATTTFTYDASDYLTQIDYPGGRYLVFAYDQAGRRKSSVDQLGHTLIYHYDAVGRLENVESKADANSPVMEIVHYYYDNAGRLQRKVLGNGMYATYEYDAAGQLLHLVNYLPDNSVISRFDYTYDNRSRRTSMATYYGTWTYQYDDIGQLTRAVLDSNEPEIPDQNLIYVYDALGNRIRTIENGVTTGYTMNNLNQYMQVGDTTYVFDLDGNLIEERSPYGTPAYTYNDENRLVAVSKGGDTWHYTYDAFGNRVATTENGITTHYVIDPIGLGNVVGEYDGSGNLAAHYDHGLGLLSRTDVAGNPVYYAFDAIGNVHQLLTSAGAIANSYAYMPFGTLLRQTQTIANPFQFVGQFGVMKERNGLNFMRARYLSPVTGRFTSWDPVDVVGQGSFYEYAANNPLHYIDPRGEYIPGLGGLIGGGIWGWHVAKEYGLTGVDFWAEVVGRGALGALAGTGIELGLFGAGAVGFMEPFYLPLFIGHLGMHLIYGPHFASGGTHFDIGWQNFEMLLPMIWDILQSPIFGKQVGVSTSVDPNRKIGPAGMGSAGYIKRDELLSYRVDFENDPNATAPAQQVIITDPLDSDLDWTTFQLTEIGFGDRLIVVPENTQHYETTIPVEYNNVEFEVQIEAGIHSSSGQMYATFHSIDPNTGLPPTVDIGFLPPEDGTGRGQGHISYTIKPKANLSSGTQITNSATISFDLNPAITTDETLNTIDIGSPSSYVLPLPAISEETDFLVEWTGQDDIGGSGIAHYDIYVSADGGGYFLWLDNASDTNAVFTGEPGHTYAFYSIATDDVGNIEMAPAQPDTITAVSRLGLRPVDDLVDISVGRVDYDRRTQRFGVNVTVTNTSGTVISSPVWLVIKDITNPAVTVANPDGTTADGKPYVDLTALLGDGQLEPGESITKRIYFNNPNRVRFTFEPSVRGVIIEPGQDAGLAGLARISQHWLQNAPSLDVAPVGGDGVINFLDFAVLANHWLKGTTP